VPGLLSVLEWGGPAEVGGFALPPAVLHARVEQEQPSGVDHWISMLVEGHATFESSTGPNWERMGERYMGRLPAGLRREEYMAQQDRRDGRRLPDRGRQGDE
jgi:hypothetical protein